MLIPNFYTLEAFSAAENEVQATISLNPHHEVYKGHFLNQPVVPGVIQLQIIKELMQKAVNNKLMLSEVAFVKYLKVIIPDRHPKLSLTINYSRTGNSYSFSVVINSGEIIFTKAKGVLNPKN